MANRCAALTICHNEPDWIGAWHRYVSQHFEADDIYILNDGDDHYVDHLDAVIVNTSDSAKPYVGDTNLRVTVNSKFIELLDKGYDYVMYCDCDMFVVPDPEDYPGGLSQLMQSLDKQTKGFIHCSGYDVMCMKDESPLDINNPPLLAQRTYWHRDYVHLCKVPIACENPVYGGGFHASKWNPARCTKEIMPTESNNIRLIHMGWSCTAMVERRWKNRRASGHYAEMWNPEWAQKYVDGLAYHSNFERELIPDKWKAAL